MASETYNEAMVQVYSDEGGYSNDVGDPGGPTNYGITIHDARSYWKSDATAADVKTMPKSVAADIYSKHYATPLQYNSLPPGVDYAVLDYGINSGISRSAKVLQQIVGVTADGQIGPATLLAVYKMDAADIVNKIYAERLTFLRSLGTFSIFGKGWTTRCTTGKALALKMITEDPNWKPPVVSNTPAHSGAGAVIAAGAVTVSQYPHLWLWIVCGTIAAAIATWLIINYIKRK